MEAAAGLSMPETRKEIGMEKIDTAANIVKLRDDLGRAVAYIESVRMALDAEHLRDITPPLCVVLEDALCLLSDIDGRIERAAE